ncbi:Mom family adenine methylcarbamoylation protein, partial [Streptomyces bullii]
MRTCPRRPQQTGRDSEPPGSRDAAVRGLGRGTVSVALVPAVAGGKALLAPRPGWRLRCPELPRGRHPRGRAGQDVCARAPLLAVVPGGEGAVRPVRRLRQQASLCGVAVFGVPVSTAVLTKPLPGLRPYKESLVCSRFVLLDECPGNSESWFLARCFDALLADGVRGVVSFADPVPRRTASGRLGGFVWIIGWTRGRCLRCGVRPSRWWRSSRSGWRCR